VTASRYYRRFPGDRRLVGIPSELSTFLESLPINRAVLFPCADDWVVAVSRVSQQSTERFASYSPDPTCLDRILNKDKLALFLIEHGIDCPRTIVIARDSDFGVIEEFPDSRWFLKPVNSQHFRKRYGVKAMHVRSSEEAARRRHDLQQAGYHPVLQEYVPGPASNHYFIDGFVDRSGQIRSLFARRRNRMFPTDFGDSSSMSSIPLKDVSAAIEATEHLLTQCRYRGIFSVEFKRDERDGRFRVIEVNVRAWAYIGFAAECGVNVALQAYQDALGFDAPAPTTHAVGKNTIFLPNDYFACRQLVREKRLSRYAWVQSWLKASHVVFSWTDPLPGMVRLLAGTRKKLRTMLGRSARR
jgi:D-aspartate ligase